MPTYKLSAHSVGYLEAVVESDDLDRAYELLDKMLENGELEERDSWIDYRMVEPADVSEQAEVEKEPQPSSQSSE